VDGFHSPAPPAAVSLASARALNFGFKVPPRAMAPPVAAEALFKKDLLVILILSKKSIIIVFLLALSSFIFPPYVKILASLSFTPKTVLNLILFA
jgi:hypothetical protein